MGKGFKHGSSGASLNFKVIAYATEELLKAAQPRENSIGVVTDKEITGYYFCATQPENMAEGEVWFFTDHDSSVSFNALRKNTVQVYLTSAKQYVDGSCVLKLAYIYKNGVWNQFSYARLYIFKENEGLTSGYEVKYSTSNSGFSMGSDKITFSSDKTVGNNVYINPKVDLAHYNSLYVELTCKDRFDSSYSVTIGVGSDIPTGRQEPGSFDASVNKLYSTTRNTYIVPVSNVPYERYIKIAAFAVTGYIHNIWLE